MVGKRSLKSYCSAMRFVIQPFTGGRKPIVGARLTPRVGYPPAHVVKEIGDQNDLVHVRSRQVSAHDESITVGMQIERARSGASVNRLLRPLLWRVRSKRVPFERVRSDHQMEIRREVKQFVTAARPPRK